MLSWLKNCIWPTVPDDDHIFSDPDGAKWYEYTCSFNVQGQNFIFSIWAQSFEDAEKRLVALKATARVDGQLYRELDA